MEKNYRLTFDFGSGSVKAALIDQYYHPAGVENAPYPTCFPKNGWAEQKPEDLWQAMTGAAKRLLTRTGIPPESVVGIALAHTATSVIFTDGQGRPLSDCVMWMDGRAGEQAERINSSLGENRYCGKNVIAKLAWFLEERPDLVEKSSYMLDVAAFLIHRMTGEFVYELTGARSTCLVDVEREDWDQAQFDLIGFPRRLVPQRIVRSAEKAGALSVQAAESMGLVPEIPVFGGCSDHAAAILGTASTEPGDAHIYIGTSAWLAVTTAADDPHPGRMPSPAPGMRYHFYDTDSGGACLDFLLQLFYPQEKEEPFAKMNEDVRRLQDAGDEEDIIFLPFLAGASAPIADTSVRGGFLNLKRSTEREHMARAVLEGVCFNLRWMHDIHTEETGRPVTALRGVGGGMRSPALVQTLSDVMGIPVTPVEDPRFAGNLGLAACVDIGLGNLPDFTSLASVIRGGQTCVPNPRQAARYDRLYQVYRQAYEALAEVYQRLNPTRGV